MINRNGLHNRRNFLKTTAGVATLLSGVGGRAVAEDPPLADDPVIPGGTNTDSTKAQRREFLIAEYGVRETSIIQAVAEKLRRRVENTDLTADEAFQQAGDELLQHPQTPNVSADIRDRRQLVERFETEPTVTSATIGTSAVGDKVSVAAGFGQKGKSTWGIGAADVDFNVSTKTAYANARVAGIGGASSFSNLYGRITPNSSIGGAVRMTVKYFRQGGVVGGNARVKFFVRETARPSTTAVYFPVETPGFVQGSVTKSAQFVIPAGVQHDVGVQLETSVDTIAAAYFYADYFTTVLDLSRRRITLESPIQIESLD